MNSLSTIFEFIIIQAGFAFTPGLIITLIVNESIQKSRKKGLEVAAGAAVGALVMTLLSSLIVTFLFAIIPTFLQIIFVVGSIYIIYKGFSTLAMKNIGKEGKSNQGAFVSGLRVNLINPKMWLFYLSVLPIFVENYESLFTSLIFLGIITVFINLIGDIFYALFSSYFFSDSSEKTKNIINKVCGVSLISIGFYLLFTRFF